MSSPTAMPSLRDRLLRVVALLCAAALIAGLLAAAALAAVTHRVDIRPTAGKDGLITILAIGSDLGMPYRSGNPLRANADGIHIIAVDPAAKRATIVNIPRDTLYGGRKINAHLALGGPEGMVAAVEGLSGIPMDYWALTTFRGIEEMTRVMGGVDIVVERRMVDAFSGSNLEPGPIRVEGPQALAYLRDRKSFSDGDFSRTRNHGNFMRFTHAQIHATQSDLRTLAYLTALFARMTVSNIPTNELLPLAFLATQIPPENVHQVPLAGSFGTTAGGASIVHLQAGNTFERIRAGQVGPP